MFTNVDDGRRTDAGVTGMIIAHLGAFRSGELKTDNNYFLRLYIFMSTSLIIQSTDNSK